MHVFQYVESPDAWIPTQGPVMRGTAVFFAVSLNVQLKKSSFETPTALVVTMNGQHYLLWTDEWPVPVFREDQLP